MKSMQIDLAFFDDDTLLCRGSVVCSDTESENILTGSDHQFKITHQFEEPASPVFITCLSEDNKLYETALRVGVHNSEDWESIDLAKVHTLAFRCKTN
jgi:hypothetical protein